MPTARELLEQADALMRRNRAAAGAAPRGDGSAAGPPHPDTQGEPVYTVSPRLPTGPATLAPHFEVTVGPATLGPATVAPTVESPAVEPSRPAWAATPALGPVAPAAGPDPSRQWADAAGAAAMPSAAGAAALDEIAAMQADAAAESARAPATDVELDIPLLTDDVAPVDAGATAAGPSIPAVAARPAAPEFDDVPVLTDAIEAIETGPVVAATDAGEPSVWLEEERSEPGAAGPDTVSGPATPPERDPLGLDRPAPGYASFGATAELSALPPLPQSLLRSPPAPTAGTAFAPVALVPPAAPPDGSAAASTARLAPPPRDSEEEARFQELAEEIRMQVLQRIDIFTDTGLRAQLGERLKPVVDRASADLVATINQHVGELLRAYVAEAIEREIERLRSGNAG